MSVLERLAGALNTTPADLAELDIEIARLQGVRELVARALAIAPAPVVHPIAKPKPKALAAPSSRDKAPERRAAVCRLLAEAGPLGSVEICRRLSIPEGTITQLMKSELFAKQSADKFAPWVLTDGGRAVAAGREAGN
jgi:hypothetical protein